MKMADEFTTYSRIFEIRMTIKTSWLKQLNDIHISLKQIYIAF